VKGMLRKRYKLREGVGRLLFTPSETEKGSPEKLRDSRTKNQKTRKGKIKPDSRQEGVPRRGNPSPQKI